MVAVRPRPVLIALVAIVAIALAAATLTTAVTHDGFGGTGGEGRLGSGPGDAVGPQSGDGPEPPSIDFPGIDGAKPLVSLPCLGLLTEGRFLLGLALVAAAGLYLLYRRTDALVPVAVVVALGPPGFLLYALLTACGSTDRPEMTLSFADRTVNASDAFTLFSGSGGGGAAAGGQPTVSLALVGVLGLALVAAVAVLVRATDHEVPEPPAAEEPDSEQIAAIGRAAGRAADRIEDDADPDNAVYRAWKEMTDRLEVANPAASTPAEFASAAVEAGMDAGDVDELTSLFEAVRYGTAAPTEDREARAVAALRRIEDTYARGEP